jgi:hypothetical protein
MIVNRKLRQFISHPKGWHLSCRFYVKKYNGEGKKFNWKFILVIGLTVVGAVLVAVGGLADSVFATLAGAVIGILTVIFGVIVSNKKKEVTSK